MGRSPALAAIRKNAKFWLTLNMILAILVVCISGVLRSLPAGSKPAKTPSAAAVSPAGFVLRS